MRPRRGGPRPRAGPPPPRARAEAGAGPGRRGRARAGRRPGSTCAGPPRGRRRSRRAARRRHARPAAPARAPRASSSAACAARGSRRSPAGARVPAPASSRSSISFSVRPSAPISSRASGTGSRSDGLLSLIAAARLRIRSTGRSAAPGHLVAGKGGHQQRERQRDQQQPVERGEAGVALAQRVADGDHRAAHRSPAWRGTARRRTSVPLRDLRSTVSGLAQPAVPRRGRAAGAGATGSVDASSSPSAA